MRQPTVGTGFYSPDKLMETNEQLMLGYLKLILIRLLADCDLFNNNKDDEFYQQKLDTLKVHLVSALMAAENFERCIRLAKEDGMK